MPNTLYFFYRDLQITVTLSLVPGQNAAQLRTATFSAAVESVDIDTMAAGGQVLSSRSVRLPPGISGDGAASQHRVLCATS
jgi:hypothetical protein